MLDEPRRPHVETNITHLKSRDGVGPISENEGEQNEKQDATLWFLVIYCVIGLVDEGDTHTHTYIKKNI